MTSNHRTAHTASTLMDTCNDAEPTPVDLAAIEAEWPLIEAELDLLDAEISLIYAEDHGGPTELNWRRVRRAAHRVMRAAAALDTPVRLVRLTA